jgi:tripartite-type tricarboxylate transporter receptor subunit TctC
VVENRPGAGSIIGTDLVEKAAPDGYTLLMMANTHAINETFVPKRPYRLMRDFVPIATANYSDLVMILHPSVPAKNLREFLALARRLPGKLNYASSGQGTTYHMAGEMFKTLSKTNIVHVPFKTAGEARASVMGGHLELMFDAISIMAPNVRAGKVRALGTTGTKRSAILPEVPTINEGGVAGDVRGTWCGVMAPSGTPKEIVALLNAEINKVIKKPVVAESWAKQGAVPMVMTAAEFDTFVRKEIEDWAVIVKASGAKLD